MSAPPRIVAKYGQPWRTFAMAALAAGASLALLVLIPPSAASAHDERTTIAPDGTGIVPAYRPAGTTLLVCPADKADFDNRVSAFPADLKAGNDALWIQCQASGYRNLQDAVNNVKQPNTIIKILPGIYLEEPSLAAPKPECASLPAVPSWDQQVLCPNNQNLVAILDKTGLQIEGTGAKPDDVIIDAQFKKLVAVRADRSPGVYLRNFTVQRTISTAVYVLESEGFAVDTMVGRFNGENGFESLAGDHGLITNCAAYGNGDAGISVKSSANINRDDRRAVDRYAIEIKGCHADQNLLGYSGVAGNSVWAHDNVFTDNTVGVSVDSSAENLAGLPQNHALFENNVIAGNNEDFYHYVRDGSCQKPMAQRGIEDGVVCPIVGVPVGTGVITTGGNYNLWRANWVYANTYAGFVTTWVPGFVRENNSLGAQFDTSHHDAYDGNRMGVAPDGTRSANGMDFWWDGQGKDSCWQRPSWDGAEPRVLPACGAGSQPAGFGTSRYVAEPGKVLKLLVCSDYDLAKRKVPSDCDWFGARGFDRIEVKYALGEAILLGLVLLILWWRLLSGSGLAFFGLALSLGGLVAGVYGTTNETTPLTAIGLGLVGLGMMCVGAALRRRGRNGLGWLTVFLALFAMLGGIDRGLFMLPWIPVPPSVVRIGLEILWVPCAIFAAAHGRMLAITRTPADERPGRRGGGRGGSRDRLAEPADPLERFAANLRD